MWSHIDLHTPLFGGLPELVTKVAVMDAPAEHV